MTNKTVKKWPMNDFLIALEKLFEEHDSCLQVDPQGYIADASGVYTRLDKALDKTNIGNFINDSLRPEKQIKEQKMDKQKYKYVNAGIKTVGELVDKFKKGKLFNPEGKEILASFQHEGLRLDWIKFENLDCAPSLLTTRQPLPWYEVEGVFPCLVRNGKYLYPVVATGIHEESRTLKIQNCHDILVDYCEPFNKEQAAKYGVEAQR